MQLQVFLLMIFIMIILPVILLFSNHDIFFVVVALILLIMSIKNLHQSVVRQSESMQTTYGNKIVSQDDDDGITPEEIGISGRVVKNLIIILFYIYCTFFIYSIVFKGIILAIMLYWLYDTLNSPVIVTTDGKDESAGVSLKINSGNHNVVLFIINITTIILIVFVTCNKFIRRII